MGHEAVVKDPLLPQDVILAAHRLSLTETDGSCPLLTSDKSTSLTSLFNSSVGLRVMSRGREGDDGRGNDDHIAVADLRRFSLKF